MKEKRKEGRNEGKFRKVVKDRIGEGKEGEEGKRGENKPDDGR